MPGQQSLGGNQAGQRSHRVRSATEPDQKQPVALLIIARQKGVAAQHMGDQPNPDRPADLLLQPVAVRTDAVDVFRDMLDRAFGGRTLPLLLQVSWRAQRVGARQGIEQLEHIALVRAVRALPGAVGKIDQIAGHASHSMGQVEE